MPEIRLTTFTVLAAELRDAEVPMAPWAGPADGHPAAATAHACVSEHGGVLLQRLAAATGFVAHFPTPRDAAMAAAALLRALGPAKARPAVAVALHCGLGVNPDDSIVQETVGRRCVALRAAASPGQILVSALCSELLAGAVPAGFTLRDLGLHRLPDLQQEHIYELTVAQTGADGSVRLPVNAHPHNLPVQSTPFIGRETACAEVRRRMGQSRLVTLCGPGGSGKTRLALQVAGEQVARFADGVWLVELSPLAEPDLLPHAVASALGLRDEPGTALTETLMRHLKTRNLLLVMDNCEHLVAAAADLAQRLLMACAGVQMLATSRKPLGIWAEDAWTVLPLTTPDPDVRPQRETLLECEAVRLFVERARAVMPFFTVTDENAAALARICRRLDGIPLAIELAAARVKVLSLPDIADRLDDRFRLLTGGPSPEPRQQTLRAAMDWGYELLSEPERILLRRLSVFAGTCTPAAAEAVCAGNDIAPDQVLDLIGQLIDKSLLTARVHQGETRYAFLETVRDYGYAKLRAAGEEDLLRGRHVLWYEQLGVKAFHGLNGPALKEWLDRLQREEDNLRHALAWCQHHSDLVDAGLHLLYCIALYWWERGSISEGRMLIGRLLAVLPADVGQLARSNTARTNAHRVAGMLAAMQGDYTVAESMFQRGLAMARTSADTSNELALLENMGTCALVQGHLDESRELWSAVLNHPHGRENPTIKSLALHSMGAVAYYQGDYDQAEALELECLKELQVFRNVSYTAYAHLILAQVARRRLQLPRAFPLYAESLRLFVEVGHRPGQAEALEGLAAALEAGGLWLPAAHALGAAAALREAGRITRDLPDVPTFEETQAGLRAALSPAALEQALHQGQTMTVAQILAALPAGSGEAAAAAAQVAAAATPAPAPAAPATPVTPAAVPVDAPASQTPGTPPAEPLTRRELDIVHLVAQGLTDREIGGRLYISHRTVDAHLRNIFGKVGVTSRAKLAVWAVQNGLGGNP